jgi:SH3-like domain-containing protein
VRCGPAESYYPTMKLDKGARVTVVGMKLDWLKIVPPDGSFCYISKAFVDRNGDGTAGKVNKDAVNVRAGSTLNSLKVVPLCQLSIGMDVKILGEQDEYYKIVPPEGKAFVYVNKQFVEPDPNARPEPIAPPKDGNVAGGLAKKDGAGKKDLPPAQPNKGPEKKIETVGGADDGGEKLEGGAHPTTQPTDGIAQGPTTQPSGEDVAAAGAAFDKAETQYAATASKLDAKVIADLLKEYEGLASGGKLPSTLQRVADNRIATLKIRSANAEELVKAQAAQEDMRKKTQSP